MAARRPLVVVAGRVRELPTEDVLDGGSVPLTPAWVTPTLVSGNTYSLPNPVAQHLLLWQRSLILTENYHYTQSGSELTLLGETTPGAADRAQPIIDQIAANSGNPAGILEALRYTGLVQGGGAGGLNRGRLWFGV